MTTYCDGVKKQPGKTAVVCPLRPTCARWNAPLPKKDTADNWILNAPFIGRQCDHWKLWVKK